MKANILREHLDYQPTTGIFTWRKNGKPAGCKHPNGYVVIRLQGRLYYAHRLAWVHVHGNGPKQVIDHINQDKGDNRISNLRDVSQSANVKNSDKLRDLNAVRRFRRGIKWKSWEQLEIETRYGVPRAKLINPRFADLVDLQTESEGGEV